MNKKKVIIAVCVVVAVVLAIFGLTRCSRTTTTEITETKTTAEPAVTEEPAATPEATAAPEPAATPEPTAEPEPAPEVNEDGSDKISHILLIGTDNNNTAGIDKLGDADGIVLVSINRTDKTISLTSILGGTVLDVAYHQGVREQATLIYNEYGLETFAASVEKTLGITLENYLSFNYLNVIELIDDAGGVDVEVKAQEVSIANGLIQELNKDLLGCDSDDGLITETSGTVHLTGKQALCIMRVTMNGETHNDFGRSEKIRNVLLQLKDQFLAMDTSAQSDFIKNGLSSIQAIMSINDGLGYLDELDTLSTFETKTGCIPQDDTYYSNDSYIHMNIAQNRIWFFGQVYGETESMPESLRNELAHMQAELDAGRYVQYQY